MGKMDKNVDFLVSDIPLVEKNWWPPDFTNLTILCPPLPLCWNESLSKNFLTEYHKFSWTIRDCHDWKNFLLPVHYFRAAYWKFRFFKKSCINSFSVNELSFFRKPSSWLLFREILKPKARVISLPYVPF